MSNITIYIDDSLEKRLRAAAKKEGISVSRLVARYVQEKTRETWPDEVLKLAGAWGELERPASGLDHPRESL